MLFGGRGVGRYWTGEFINDASEICIGWKGVIWSTLQRGGKVFGFKKEAGVVMLNSKITTLPSRKKHESHDLTSWLK